MIPFLMTFVHFVRAIRNGLRDPEFRSLLIVVVVALLTGTIFYAKVEGWGIINSLYFSVITLTTVGYGDFSPTTAVSKIFTIIYILSGISIILAFINKLTISAQRRSKTQGKNTLSDEEE